LDSFVVCGFSVHTASAAEDSEAVVVEVQSAADDKATLTEYLSGKFSTSPWAQELALFELFRTLSVIVQSYLVVLTFVFSALILMVGRQEEHPACKNE